MFDGSTIFPGKLELADILGVVCIPFHFHVTRRGCIFADFPLITKMEREEKVDRSTAALLHTWIVFIPQRQFLPARRVESSSIFVWAAEGSSRFFGGSFYPQAARSTSEQNRLILDKVHPGAQGKSGNLDHWPYYIYLKHCLPQVYKRLFVFVYFFAEQVETWQWKWKFFIATGKFSTVHIFEPSVSAKNRELPQVAPTNSLQVEIRCRISGIFCESISGIGYFHQLATSASSLWVFPFRHRSREQRAKSKRFLGNFPGARSA